MLWHLAGHSLQDTFPPKWQADSYYARMTRRRQPPRNAPEQNNFPRRAAANAMTQRGETPMEPDEGLWQHMFIDKDLDDAGLLPAEFRVYAHLCRRADKKTHIAWPGVDSMAGTIRANRTTIIDAIEELEARRFIKVSRQIGRRSNYEILPKYCWQSKSNQSEIGNVSITIEE
jgi:hypothetical protein